MGTLRSLVAAVLLAIVSGCSGGGSDDPTGPPIVPDQLSEEHIFRVDWKKVGPPEFTPAVDAEGYVIHLAEKDGQTRRRIKEDTEVVLELIDTGEQFRRKVEVTGETLIFYGAPADFARVRLYYSFGGVAAVPDQRYLVMHDIWDLVFTDNYIEVYY